MHLSISPVNRKLRAATHGNGVYEIDLLTPQNLRQPIEAIFASATMETTNQRIRTNFYLKNTQLLRFYLSDSNSLGDTSNFFAI